MPPRKGGNLSISIIGSLLLWFFLPRGVVLTKAELLYGKKGYKPPYDDLEVKGSIWRVKNESSLPVVILKVTLSGMETYDESTESLKKIDVTDTDDEHLILDDYGDTRWRGHIVDPGESFLANVGINSDLTIEYRRAGWSGVLERRQLMVFGGL